MNNNSKAPLFSQGSLILFKKSLTTRFGQDRQVHSGQRGCAPCRVQSAVHRQADHDGRTAFAGIGRTHDCALLLHSGFGQIPQLSGRYDLYPANPDAVPSSGPRTQRTLACSGALPDGRVRPAQGSGRDLQPPDLS